MASVVFYFQVHQPHRLRKYSVFDSDPFYFEDGANKQICEKVADKCYRPATKSILDLVRRHEGNFRVSYAITGTVLDQFEKFCPDVIDLFVQLAETGCCEFVGETYYHSLAFIYSREEFREQVQMHTKKVQDLFGQTPRVFRNTELIYHNDLARELAPSPTRRATPASTARCAKAPITCSGTAAPTTSTPRPPMRTASRCSDATASPSGCSSRTIDCRMTSPSGSRTAGGPSGR